MEWNNKRYYVTWQNMITDYFYKFFSIRSYLVVFQFQPNVIGNTFFLFSSIALWQHTESGPFGWKCGEAERSLYAVL